MKKPYLAGNWKMNLDRQAALELVGALRQHLGERRDVDVALIPPFVYLADVARALAGSAIKLGAQDVCDQKEGAFTGEVSAAMLRDVGATLAVVGHSERRHVYGETDALVQAKVRRALEAGLEIILCVGETLAERDANATERVVKTQLVRGLEGTSGAELARVTIAYEPVWAIGTGRNATPEQAGEVHRYLRGLVSGLHGEAAAARLRILYGGSVKGDNVRALLAVEGVDGALVGGASISAKGFVPILDFARAPAP